MYTMKKYIMKCKRVMRLIDTNTEMTCAGRYSSRFFSFVFILSPLLKKRKVIVCIMKAMKINYL